MSVLFASDRVVEEVEISFADIERTFGELYKVRNEYCSNDHYTMNDSKTFIVTTDETLNKHYHLMQLRNVTA